MFATKIRPMLLGLGLLSASGAPALAGTASFFVIHGIPGRDVAETLDPALPVDVLVDGKLCLLKNFTFGQIAGPYDVPTGTYSLAISLANPIAPCSGKAVISASVTLTNGEFGAVVAQLSSKGAPTAGVYPVNVSKISPGDQRFVVIHAADAPAVQVSVQSLQTPSEKASFTLDPGATKAVAVPESDSFTAQIAAGGNIVGTPITVKGGDQSLFLIAAVGNASTGSVKLLTQDLSSVH